MGRSAARMIAGVGAFATGYLKGRQLRRESDWEDEQRAQQRQRWDDDKALRDAISGSDNTNAAPALAAGATDIADVVHGNVQPRSAEIQTVQRVGDNVYSDQTAAGRAAEMENFASGADESQAPKVEPTAAYRVAGRGIFNNATDAIDAQQAAQSDKGMAPVGVRGKPERDDFGIYLDRIAPRAMKTLIGQGKLNEAKALNDMLETQQGQKYTRAWGGAMRKVSVGDYDGAIPDLEKLYGDVPDGRSVKVESLGEGKYRVNHIDDASGKLIGSRDMASGDLAKMAIMALDPAKIASTFVSQQGERAKETATLDRQIKLEEIRQQGREVAEDRRDERLNLQLGAMDTRLGKQLEVQRERNASRGGLTAAQQRSNAEIDAAHRTLAGLTDEEIRDRSTTTMQNGRENKFFDPAIASAAKLSRRRKIGDDPDFDGRTGNQASAAASTRAEVAHRFRADRTMNNRTLGKETPNGIEVMEKGKLIGYFR